MTKQVFDYIDYSLRNWEHRDLVSEIVRLYKDHPEEIEKWKKSYEESLIHHPYKNLNFPEGYFDSLNSTI